MHSAIILRTNKLKSQITANRHSRKTQGPHSFLICQKNHLELPVPFRICHAKHGIEERHSMQMRRAPHHRIHLSEVHFTEGGHSGRMSNQCHNLVVVDDAHHASSPLSSRPWYQVHFMLTFLGYGLLIPIKYYDSYSSSARPRKTSSPLEHRLNWQCGHLRRYCADIDRNGS